MARKKRSRKNRPLFVIIYIFMLLLLIESSARFIARVVLVRRIPSFCETTQKDPVYHHIWIPSQRTLRATYDIPYTLITNKQSWVEEHDVDEQKKSGIYRIFYLGDSTVQAVVAPEYKMVEIVEDRLNKRFESSGVGFEIINTGTSSYSFLQYYMLCKEKLPDYDPDLVVINVDMTDVVNDAVYRKSLMKTEKGELQAILPPITGRYIMTPHGYTEVEMDYNLPKWLVDFSDVFYLAEMVLRYKYTRKSLGQVNSEANWLAKEWNTEIWDNVYESVETLSQTIKLLKGRGIKVAVTSVPHYPQYTGEWSKVPHYVLQDVVEDEGVPFLNSFEALKDEIEGTEQPAYYWKSDETHFNREGNRIWALAQLDFLLDPANDLLPFEALE